MLLPDALIEEMGRDQTQGLELPNAPGCGFGLGFSVLRDPQLAESPESSGTWRWGELTVIHGLSTDNKV